MQPCGRAGTEAPPHLYLPFVPQALQAYVDQHDTGFLPIPLPNIVDVELPFGKKTTETAHEKAREGFAERAP